MLAEKEFFISKAIGWVCVVKDALQHIFRENSANPERYLPVCLTYR